MANRPGAGVSAHALAVVQGGVFRAASRLVEVNSREPGLLSLTTTRILDNAIHLLCENGGILRNVLALAFGFGGIAVGVYTKVWQNKIFQWAFDATTSRFKGSVTITSGNPLNKTVMLHLVKNGLGKDARTLTVVNPEEAVSHHHMMIYDHREPKPKKHEEVVSTPDPVDYIPSVGLYSFTHNGYRMTMTRDTCAMVRTTKHDHASRHPSDPATPHNITITCWSMGAGVEPVKDFLQQVTIEASKAEKGNKTTVFKMKTDNDSGFAQWDTGVSRPARTLDSVAIEKQKKEVLVKEIARYLSTAEEQYYAARGIPYRRGLLFYRPPGTGKTSFAVALSGHCKLNLYIVSTSNRSMNDQDLEALFELLPHRCVVLIEDIDSSGIQREAPDAEPEPQLQQQDEALGRHRRRHRAASKRTGVTLAGLLNVLDGPASKDGRLVCMTSNNPDVLDAALLRPGRIDSKILFDYASREVSALLFSHIFTRTAEEIAAEIASQESPHDIPALASRFASHIPEGKITPAEVQNFLLRNRDDPLGAVAGAAAFAGGVLEAKERNANVAAFANEIAAPPANKPEIKQPAAETKAPMPRPLFSVVRSPVPPSPPSSVSSSSPATLHFQLGEPDDDDAIFAAMRTALGTDR